MGIGGEKHVEPLNAGDPSYIAGYRLLGRLGRGGMGRVFLGESRGGRKVAVKLIRPEYADDPEFRMRFAREVEAARKVGGFHTAMVVDADPYADPPWMVTCYIPGPSLLAAVQEHGPLTLEEVNSLGAGLVEGLSAIHDCELIHRDLKPSNVILAPDGPRIIDFGVARSIGATAITMTGIAVGSIRYMSPEQLGVGEVCYASDIFSLGSLLVFAATGHGPFDSATSTVTMAHILAGKPNLGDLTGDLRDIISECLAKDPAGRPQPQTLLARFAGTREPSTVVPVPPVLPAPPVLSAPPVLPAPRPSADDVRIAPPRHARGPAAAPSAPPGLASEGHRLNAQHSEIRLVSFSPDGRLVATGAADWSVCVWDVATWRPVARPASCDKPAGVPVRGFRQLVFTADSRTVLATRESESVVWRLDAATGQLTATALAGPRTGSGAGGASSAPVLSPDGRYGLYRTGGALVLADIAAEKWAELRMYPPGGEEAFGDMVFAADGGLVGVVDSREQVHLWTTSTGAWVGRLDSPQELDGSPWYGIRQLVLSARMAAAICDVSDDPNGRALYVWNLAGGRPRLSLDHGRGGRLVRLGLAPDGKTIAAITAHGVSPGGSGGDVTVSMWDTGDGTRTDMAGGFYEVPELIFSPDGWLLVTMGASIMTLWDLRDEPPVSLGSRPSRFGDPFNGGVFSPDSRMLVTAEGHDARVWQRPRK